MLLNSTKISLNLKKYNYFISAIDQKIIFGKTVNEKYIFYFEFLSTEINILYITLRANLEFFLSEQVMQPSTFIKANDEIEYFWNGKSEKLVNGTVSKTIVYSILKDKETENILIFEQDTIISLLISLSHLFFSSLSIKQNEKFCFHLISNQDEDSLKQFKTNPKLLIDFLNTLINIVPQLEKSIFEISQLFYYYFEEIIIISQIKELTRTL